MNEDTIKLLEKCDSGCQMAINSMNQIEEYTKDDKLFNLIRTYKEKHQKLEDKAEKLLLEAGQETKEPGSVASAFSWFSSEMKLMLDNDNHKVSKLMMDGCNMGIQSMSEYINKYTDASDESKKIAKEIVKLDEDLMVEMENFI